MNIENINRAIDYFSTLNPETFSLRDWDYNGKKCVGGHILFLFDGFVIPKTEKQTDTFDCDESGLEERFAKHLGITVKQAGEIAYPSMCGNYPHTTHSYLFVTPTEVVKLLSHLKETGFVDWPTAINNWKPIR